MNNLKINKAKATLNSGGIASVIMGPNNSADIIDFLGPIGFDAAWIECEHGPFTWADIQNVTRAADLWGMTSIVRVNKNDITLKTNIVDGENIPARHFGIILKKDEWKDLSEKLISKNIEFIIKPNIRFKGQKGEQSTFFIKDPSGNVLEFKSFKNDGMIFDN